MAGPNSTATEGVGDEAGGCINVPYGPREHESREPQYMALTTRVQSNAMAIEVPGTRALAAELESTEVSAIEMHGRSVSHDLLHDLFRRGRSHDTVRRWARKLAMNMGTHEKRSCNTWLVLGVDEPYVHGYQPLSAQSCRSVST